MGIEFHSESSVPAEWKLCEVLHRCRQVTVDLGNIRYVDSAGLGILVSLYPIARTAGATLKYVNLVALPN